MRVRSANRVDTAVLEVTDYSAHAGIVEQAAAALGEIDVALIAHGTLPNQQACEASAEETRRQIEVNALSVISLLTELANRIGISVTNLSLLKTGKVKGMRFSTLEAICRELDCQPGDILEYLPDYV